MIHQPKQGHYTITAARERCLDDPLEVGGNDSGSLFCVCHHHCCCCCCSWCCCHFPLLSFPIVVISHHHFLLMSFPVVVVSCHYHHIPVGNGIFHWRKSKSTVNVTFVVGGSGWCGCSVCTASGGKEWGAWSGWKRWCKRGHHYFQLCNGGGTGPCLAGDSVKGDGLGLKVKCWVPLTQKSTILSIFKD